VRGGGRRKLMKHMRAATVRTSAVRQPRNPSLIHYLSFASASKNMRLDIGIANFLFPSNHKTLNNMADIQSSQPPKDLRIACLIPSATLICLELGLQDHLVGVTHECVEFLDKDYDSDRIRTLTKNGLPEDAQQGEIHKAVQEASASATCARDGTTSSDIPSLYPLVPEEMEISKPTVVITQDLCSVCAPTQSQVQEALNNTTNNPEHTNDGKAIQIISLFPSTLDEVAQSFVTIANACGIESIGVAKRDAWLDSFQKLQTTIETSRDGNLPVPRMLILEWLDPPFDSGHWTYQMMAYAGIEMAKPKTATKSLHNSWQDIYKMDPSIVVVGCCGFDLKRNVQDALVHSKQLSKLTAAKEKRIFACNGNVYIAMPGPALFRGAVVLAQCAYQDQPAVLNAIQEFISSMDGFPPSLEWEQINVEEQRRAHKVVPMSSLVPDIEDLGDTPGFGQVHKQACDEGKLTYIDPASGYSVFTELGHKKRGNCCGSGCRHCPYNHQNVKDKVSRIQQPSVLHTSSSKTLFSLDHTNIKVLMFSGGKDSFLTIRQLVKDYEQGPPFGLLLMTTFDATDRVVAHQNVSIDDVVKQAVHLDISFVGVPLRRGSGEPYAERIHAGLDVVRKLLPDGSRISSFVAGDLHLEHIRSWREKTFGGFDFTLEYPLWKKDYMYLMDDLEASGVPCRVSASTVDGVAVDTMFTREFYDKLVDGGSIDGFGECGEFHSLAMVWEVPPKVALGCKEQ
jgi:ABC-type Fe3+-hydroxamate transport system substrate-binding protein/diphthamide synthase (EF-2-diphthine--ammonia ligase)